MKPISTYVKSSGRPIREQAKEESQSVQVWAAEINKNAFVNGFKAPDKEIILSRAQLMAKELKDIPVTCISECWEVARKHYFSSPSVKHLSDAWEQVVKHSYHERMQKKNSGLKRIGEGQTLSEDDHERVMRATWATALKNGCIVPDEIKERYGL